MGGTAYMLVTKSTGVVSRSGKVFREEKMGRWTGRQNPRKHAGLRTYYLRMNLPVRANEFG